MSERKPAYPAHALDMHEERKESLEEGRGQAIDDEDLAPLVPFETFETS